MHTRAAIIRTGIRTGVLVATAFVIITLGWGSGNRRTMAAIVDGPSYRGARTPLNQAAWAGDRDQVASLIAAGADVNAKDPNGRTALQYAAEANHPEVVELLLTKGAEADVDGGIGDTPSSMQRSIIRPSSPRC